MLMTIFWIVLARILFTAIGMTVVILFRLGGHGAYWIYGIILPEAFVVLMAIDGIQRIHRFFRNLKKCELCGHSLHGAHYGNHGSRCWHEDCECGRAAYEERQNAWIQAEVNRAVGVARKMRKGA